MTISGSGGADGVVEDGVVGNVVVGDGEVGDGVVGDGDCADIWHSKNDFNLDFTYY